MKYDNFVDKFNELSVSEKVVIYNDYCIEYGCGDDTIYPFDEEFFNTFFDDDNKMEIARATFFGNIESWNDEYICFNSYGNLESMSEYSVVEHINDYLEEIFDHEDTWKDYIEEDDEDEETYVCPHCGHVFEQGEWDYNYNTSLLDFKCPECDWEGNENEVETEE